MQTFLPYADFRESAAALDRARLQKQLVETLQIMKALTVPNYGWRNHPAVRQWAGYEPTLLMYQREFCAQWESRGYTTQMFGRTVDVYEAAGLPLWFERSAAVNPPWWLGDERFHASHRANLVRKDPEFYVPKFGDLDPATPYFWPSKHEPPARAAPAA